MLKKPVILLGTLCLLAAARGEAQRTLVGEHARHGYPATIFQELFDHLADSGFWPVWLDTYSVGGKSYLNGVWRPAEKEWRAHCLRDGATHQKNSNDADKDGFGPVFVDSSVSGNQVLYTAIYVKGEPSDKIFRHGLTTSQHDTELANAKNRHLRPVNIAVVSVGGQRAYTVLYRPEKIGEWEIRSQVAEGDYQDEYDKQKKDGRRPIYLNAYMHQGKPFLSAVFASDRPEGKDRHLMPRASIGTPPPGGSDASPAVRWRMGLQYMTGPTSV
jgi:hypothetical protein